MSQIYLGDKLIASTEGSDIKYDENTSINEKVNELINELNSNNELLSERLALVNTKLDQYLSIFESTITSENGSVSKRAPENSTTSVMVQFSAPFLAVPTVTLSLEKAVNYSGGSMTSKITLTATDVTKTSFVLKIKNSHTSTNYYADCVIKWAAVCDVT